MTTSYLDVLASLHKELKPKTYLEIGVQFGCSMKLAPADSIGIDPDSNWPGVYRMTSDEYFSQHSPDPIDLAFIDGMHLIEFVLRDFMNVEKHSHAKTVVVFDDVSPPDPSWSTRERNTRQWCGDVWKIRPILERFRPDLSLSLIDASPAGVLVVRGLDKSNTVLRDNYDSIVKEYAK